MPSTACSCTASSCHSYKGKLKKKCYLTWFCCFQTNLTLPFSTILNYHLYKGLLQSWYHNFPPTYWTVMTDLSCWTVMTDLSCWTVMTDLWVEQALKLLLGNQLVSDVEIEKENVFNEYTTWTLSNAYFHSSSASVL